MNQDAVHVPLSLLRPTTLAAIVADMSHAIADGTEYPEMARKALDLCFGELLDIIGQDDAIALLGEQDAIPEVVMMD